MSIRFANRKEKNIVPRISISYSKRLFITKAFLDRHKIHPRYVRFGWDDETGNIVLDFSDSDESNPDQYLHLNYVNSGMSCYCYVTSLLNTFSEHLKITDIDGIYYDNGKSIIHDGQYYILVPDKRYRKNWVDLHDN